MHIYADITKTSNAFTHKTTDFDAAMGDTLKWYKTHCM